LLSFIVIIITIIKTKHTQILQMNYFPAGRAIFSAVILPVLTLSDNYGAYNTATKLVLSSPEDIGQGHSRIIHNLQESFQRNLPKNNAEYLRAVYMEVGDNVCDLEDHQCYYRVAKRTIRNTNNISKKEGTTNSYTRVQHLLPKDFDPEALKSMNKLMSTKATVKEVSNAVHRMYQDMQNLRNNKVVKNENHRNVVLIAYSVGMESAKQWAEILRDPKDPFNNMMDDEKGRSRRRLQFDDLDSDELSESFLKVLQGDIVGSVDGAMEGLLDSDSDKSTMTYALEAASVASLQAFVEVFLPGSGVGGDDDAGIGDCTLFPNRPGCLDDDNADNGGGGIGDCTLFPNRPGCRDDDADKEDDSVDKEDDDYCPFPSMPDCGLNLIDENPDDTSNNGSNEEGEDPTFCENYPNVPLCQNNDDDDSDDPDDTSDSNGSSNEEVDDPTFCENYPNVPLCQNNDEDDPNNDENVVENFCDQFPNNIFCQESNEP